MEKQIITPQELETLQSIQNRTQSLVIELGEIELTRLQLNEKTRIAEDTLKQIQKVEEDFTQSLLAKYGNSSLNPQTGELTILDQNT